MKQIIIMTIAILLLISCTSPTESENVTNNNNIVVENGYLEEVETVFNAYTDKVYLSNGTTITCRFIGRVYTCDSVSTVGYTITVSGTVYPILTGDHEYAPHFETMYETHEKIYVHHLGDLVYNIVAKNGNVTKYLATVDTKGDYYEIKWRRGENNTARITYNYPRIKRHNS